MSKSGCSVCEFVVKAVSSLLHMEEVTNKAHTFIGFIRIVKLFFKPAIKRELDVLCSKLGSFSGVCKSLVDNELDKIITWLQDGHNEQTICAMLKLCPKPMVNKQELV